MNLTWFLLDFIFYTIELDTKETETKMPFLHYFMYKNLKTLFGEEIIDEDIKLRKEENGAISFDYAEEKYTLFMEEKHLILRKNFNEIVFRITLNKHCLHNFIQYQEEDKMIQEFQEANFEKETYTYRKVRSTNTQEVYSIKLGATFEGTVPNLQKDLFKIVYMYPTKCNKTVWEKYWDEVRRKNVFLAPCFEKVERLEEIFAHLEERCSKEYARIKLK